MIIQQIGRYINIGRIIYHLPQLKTTIKIKEHAPDTLGKEQLLNKTKQTAKHCAGMALKAATCHTACAIPLIRFF
jgi:hypothetical protein